VTDYSILPNPVLKFKPRFVYVRCLRVPGRTITQRRWHYLYSDLISFDYGHFILDVKLAPAR
jgi:hypothetical protein